MFAAARNCIQECGPSVCRQGADSRPQVNSAATSIALSDLARLLGIAAPDGDDRAMTFPVRRLKQGETLYREGDRFDAIYVIRSGFFKSVSVDSAGAETVQAFPMGGDVVGLDAVEEGRYGASVEALDAGSVVVLNFARLADQSSEHRFIERLLYTLFSRELVRTREMTRLLGTLSAEERLATLLVDLSERFGRLGFSRVSFALRMTRQEIGSYLGIKLETVSRTLSAMVASGLIDVDLRTIGLRDVERLRSLAACPAREGKPRPHAATPEIAARASASSATRQPASRPARDAAPTLAMPQFA